MENTGSKWKTLSLVEKTRLLSGKHWVYIENASSAWKTRVIFFSANAELIFLAMNYKISTSHFSEENSYCGEKNVFST